MSRTPLLIAPTLEQVKRQAAKIGLPEREGHKFWLHYETVGWKVGKLPMKNWLTAIQGWKLRWEERGGVNNLSRGSISADDVGRTLKKWNGEK